MAFDLIAESGTVPNVLESLVLLLSSETTKHSPAPIVIESKLPEKGIASSHIAGILGIEG
jgi:hypothetical protein